VGLIAGAVIGSIAALALVGIFVLLYLRHRKGAAKPIPAEDGPSQGEKHVQEDQFPLALAYKPELATNANAWELPAQGQARAMGPWELPGSNQGLGTNSQWLKR
jgi:hypothetical protein